MKNTKLYLILVIFFILVNLLNAQEWKQIIAQYNDLPNPFVNVIKIDGFGNKWVGTNGGIGKFDGNKWTQFTILNSNLPDSQITSIEIDSSGYLWIGTKNGGISVYNHNDNVWTVYDTSNSILAGNNISKIVKTNDGKIWVLVSYPPKKGFDPSALYCFNGYIWKEYNLDSLNIKERWVKTIEEDYMGNLLLGRIGGFSRFDGNEWTNYDLPSNYDVRTDIISIVEDSTTNYFAGVGFGNHKLLKFDGMNWEIVEDYPLNSITKIQIDYENNLWFSSDEGIIKKEKTQWKYYNEENSGLLQNRTIDLAIDKANEIWIGTHKGIAVFSDNNWTYYSASYGLPEDNINDIEIDQNNNKWIATTYFGLSKYDGKNWINYSKANSNIPDNFVQCLNADNNGNLWIGTGKNGLAKFDGVDWTLFNLNNSPIPGNEIKDIFIDNNNLIWLCTNNDVNSSLVKYDGNSWTIYNSSNTILTEKVLSSVVEDGDGNIWVGSIFDGLFKFDGQTWLNFKIDNSNLPSNRINTVKIDQNKKIWVGTDKGLANLSGDSCIVYNMSNSDITGNDIRSIYIDRYNNIWTGVAYNGLNKFDGSTWKDYKIISDSQSAIIIPENLSGDNLGNLWFSDWFNGVIIFNEENILGIDVEKDVQLSETISISQNFPNPFNPQTNINYYLPFDMFVSLKIYDVLGNNIKILINRRQRRGNHTVVWDGTNNYDSKVSSGVYLYIIKGNNLRQAKKMVLLK